MLKLGWLLLVWSWGRLECGTVGGGPNGPSTTPTTFPTSFRLGPTSSPSYSVEAKKYL